jgi:hypothetical protein
MIRPMIRPMIRLSQSCRASLFVLTLVLAGFVFSGPARAIDIKAVKSPKGVTAWLIEDHGIRLRLARRRGGTVQFGRLPETA